jgi:cytochrome P450
MTVWTPTDTGTADLTSHDTFLQGPPHNTFAYLRANAPVHWTDYPDGEGFWSITRMADIVEMNRQPQIFSSARGIRMEDQTYEEYLARRTFQETDPPEHMQTRIKVAKAFSKPVIAGFEEDIRILCDDILDTALEKGTFDATKEIARQLPMRMLGRILGTPDEDLPWLVEKGDALIANTDPDFTDHVLDKMTTDEFRMMPFNSPAGAELYQYAKDLMAKKDKAGDTSGVLHLILQPGKDGSRISEEEFRNFFCLLVAAGNDTTRYSIAAGMQALTHDPRFLHLDVHGKTIRAGDKVIYWFVSANRDDAAFDDPFTFDLHRNPNRHVAFGQGGPHVCLGMWLARLEVRVLFQELAKRVKSIESAGEPKFLRSNFVGGYKELPVHVVPA